MTFRHAIVRTPAESFAKGLTTADLGAPDFRLALAQHEAYCEALLACGLALTRLPADAAHPDSMFVEDTAILLPRCAVLTRPGAASRSGEVAGIRPALEPFFPDLFEIGDPGTVDGGDICEAGETVFIGVSERTNPAGARQLAKMLQREGYRTAEIDVRGVRGILHLKSGLSALDHHRLAVIPELRSHPAFHGFELVTVGSAESYAANAVRVNDRLLIAEGYPRFADDARRLGYDPLPLEMSEFRKMDGGLSCLSLRF